MKGASSFKSEKEYSPARVSHMGISEVPFSGSSRHKLKKKKKKWAWRGESPGTLKGRGWYQFKKACVPTPEPTTECGLGHTDPLQERRELEQEGCPYGFS